MDYSENSSKNSRQIRKSGLLARLTEARDYLYDKGVVAGDLELAHSMKMRVPELREAFKGNKQHLTESFVRKFAAAFADFVSPMYLLTGKGMLEVFDSENYRPHIPIMVAAGLVDTSIETALTRDATSRPVVKFLGDYDFTLTAVGESMTPTIDDGDILACRWTSATDVRNGKIYVVDTCNGAVVKELQLAPDAAILHSLNPRFKDQRVPLPDILRLAEVVGIVRKI